MSQARADQRGVESIASERGRGLRPSRYDVVLGAIPVLLCSSVVGAFLSGYSPESLLAPAALACVIAIVDVLFVHPPTEVGDDDGVDGRGTGGRRNG
ncbi:hypothetical protein G9C85_07360 [Halorubellus sp. JP-L1]|uniref:hypothetical protein n=1 Tax=Halorubellus sp. JP-L1 TaxID=2715753 RepID=UPI00140C5F48|nr:hypothetical protein [Halorubellus sp. JP-L1]NHN41455.1 hypothetical protein [Halorubellus sp. JP-L1]